MSETVSPFALANVTKRSASLPDRIILYGVPSWGKTSFATRLPKPIFLMTPGEDRLKKLIEQGLCQETPHFPSVAQTWDHVLCVIRELTVQPHDYNTFVLDTGNGAERLAQELVCADDFNGDWGDHGFASFRKGENITADRLWMPFLNDLDRLRERRRMRIVLLCHAGVQSVRNPEAADYEKIVPALSKRAWGYTAKWVDMILYGALEVQIGKDDPKSKLAKNKAKGGRVRLLHCTPTAAYDAKNVHRLPATIRLGDDAYRAYEAFRTAFPKPQKTSSQQGDENESDHRKDAVNHEETTPAKPEVAETHGQAEQDAGDGGKKKKPVDTPSLPRLREWMKKLHFTPADMEELCAQHGLTSLDQASEEQVQDLIGELEAAYAKWQGEEENSESGNEG